MPIEFKKEFNAEGRSRASKIQSLEKYKGGYPGTLYIRVDYSHGSLNVFIEKAEDLFGKKSQDPYAIVYLLDKSGEATFQQGHNNTDTKSKTLDPVYNESFQFQMDLGEVISRSLVIAIWDRDSKSRDDYMAGIRINLQDVQHFKKNYTARLELRHQEMDGHPAAYSEEDVRTVFKWEKPRPVLSSNLDLKNCNNHLVAFIERARVLAEAYDLKSNMPTSLTNTVSVVPPDVREMFRAEIMKYKSKINAVRAEKARLDLERNNLRMENQHLKSERKTKIEVLASRRQEHYQLEVEYNDLAAKNISLNYLQERIQWIEEQIRIAQEKKRQSVGFVPGLDVSVSEMAFRESVRDMPSFGSARGDHTTQSTALDYQIKVRTEYELRIRENLDKKRSQYQVQYRDFIQNIERDAAEIIRLYEDILKEKFTPGRLDGLLAIWDKRGYQARIDILVRDIEELRKKIQNHGHEEASRKKWYDDEMARLEAQIRKLMNDIRALFARFTEFTSTRYSEFNEVSIFKQLLDYEDRRFTAPTTKVEYSVKKTASRSSHGAKAGFTLPVSSSRRMTGDSGISSPMNGTGAYQESFTSSFSQGGTVSSSGSTIRHSSRSSVGSMAGRRSQTLENLEKEMNI